MNIRRILVLLQKELVMGPKNFIFIFALIVPVLFTLVVSLVFGTYFSGKARLGILDEGSSQLVAATQSNPALSVRRYSSVAEMEDAASRGVIDMGLVLPAGFDETLSSGQATRMKAYIWGESLMQNRIILGSALLHTVREIAGLELPVEIQTTILGEGANVPWEKRLLPLMVLMTIMVGGTMVPAASLVIEKNKRTLPALNVSPATLVEVLISKGLLGALLSTFSGLLILFLNRAFGGSPLLLVTVLALGAIFSATIGTILGALVKDMSSLMATLKSIGILLYAPAIVYMFPELPDWVAKIFPTYYIIGPVLEITQNNAGLADIAPELAILLALIALSMLGAGLLARRMQEAQAAA